MKTTLSENKMRFKVIQKMRAQLGVSTNFLTVPRSFFFFFFSELKPETHIYIFLALSKPFYVVVVL